MTATYRIRRRSDQLFSTGGSAVRRNVQFSKRGKVWPSKGALSGHLRLIEDEKSWPHLEIAERVRHLYDDCEVLEQTLDGGAKVIGTVAEYVEALNGRTRR